MDLKQYKAALEAVLFAVAEPISAEKLAEVLGIEPQVVERLCIHLRDDYAEEEHGIQLLCLDGRWQFATKNEFAPQVRAALDNRRNVPLSPAALEVLAVIAYNQPVTRSFIEQVRGVDSSGVVQSLAQKGLIEESGRLDLPGRPIAFTPPTCFCAASASPRWPSCRRCTATRCRPRRSPPACRRLPTPLTGRGTARQRT